jgi:hypothetical protein
VFSALHSDSVYGAVGGALLWGIREDGASPQLRTVLNDICGDGDLQSVLQALEILRTIDPPNAVRVLDSMVAEDEALRAHLDQLIGYFMADLVRYGLLQRQPHIDVSGSVHGANVVIGGVQYVAGDLTISQTLVTPKHVVRPVAPNPPAHFTGRAGELAQLRQALAQGRNVAITGIHGMGGIGKTATALQLAATAPEFGMVLWASVGPAPAVATHLVSWARHADPEFEAGDAPDRRAGQPGARRIDRLGPRPLPGAGAGDLG